MSFADCHFPGSHPVATRCSGCAPTPWCWRPDIWCGRGITQFRVALPPVRLAEPMSSLHHWTTRSDTRPTSRVASLQPKRFVAPTASRPGRHYSRPINYTRPAADA